MNTSPAPARFRLLVLAISATAFSLSADEWVIDSQEEWTGAIAQQDGLVIAEGVAGPSGKTATFQSKVKQFEKKRSLQSVTFEQSPVWQNWNPIENVGPSNLADAPVLLCKAPDDYWIFGRYGGNKRGGKGKKGKNAEQKEPPFVAQDATLEGFDIPLKTTPFPNQFNAPGGLNPTLGGYHAWQSRDMVNWVHHGPVTEGFSRWVTSAEYIEGKTLIYYDFPNDQDPHVYVDEDLTDGKPGENMGMAVADPSHGSDAGFIRDLDGKVHSIFENWDPINASKRSWDSPLAGRAVSADGVSGFQIQKLPPVDNRTKPTGRIETYQHPHWVKEDPANYDTSIAEFEVHEPEQEAYGDWAAISIGGRYYLFADYDPAGGHEMSVGWFTSPSIDEPFTWCDHIGQGHPDPDIGFAEGQFYLVTQQQTDWVSPGPWVEKIEARAGVDTDGDDQIDEWTEWQEIKETYSQVEGFAKQVAKTEAQIDTSSLPAGTGFSFEFRISDETENKSRPMVDRVRLGFE